MTNKDLKFFFQLPLVKKNLEIFIDGNQYLSYFKFVVLSAAMTNEANLGNYEEIFRQIAIPKAMHHHIINDIESLREDEIISIGKKYEGLHDLEPSDVNVLPIGKKILAQGYTHQIKPEIIKASIFQLLNGINLTEIPFKTTSAVQHDTESWGKSIVNGFAAIDEDNLIDLGIFDSKLAQKEIQKIKVTEETLCFTEPMAAVCKINNNGTVSLGHFREMEKYHKPFDLNSIITGTVLGGLVNKECANEILYYTEPPVPLNIDIELLTINDIKSIDFESYSIILSANFSLPIAPKFVNFNFLFEHLENPAPSSFITFKANQCFIYNARQVKMKMANDQEATFNLIVKEKLDRRRFNQALQSALSLPTNKKNENFLRLVKETSTAADFIEQETKETAIALERESFVALRTMLNPDNLLAKLSTLLEVAKRSGIFEEELLEAVFKIKKSLTIEEKIAMLGDFHNCGYDFRKALARLLLLEDIFSFRYKRIQLMRLPDPLKIYALRFADSSRTINFGLYDHIVHLTDDLLGSESAVSDFMIQFKILKESTHDLLNLDPTFQPDNRWHFFKVYALWEKLASRIARLMREK